jgi:hypothetical protein
MVPVDRLRAGAGRRCGDVAAGERVATPSASNLAMALPRRETLRQAELVFKARVTELGASTMPEVPASDTTIVAVVESVYEAPDVLRFLAGKSITVITQDAGTLHAGQDVLFLAKGWLYGESIAVVEVGRESHNVDYEDLPKHLKSEAEAARDEALLERIRSAEVVVAGKVVATRPMQALNLGNAGEHAPLWAEATIQVTSLAKGALSSSEVRVVYPESLDVKWYRAPKFRVGQDGVWILRKQRIEELGREEFTALNLLDFHSMDSLNRLRGLIRRTV